jgi:hypothetical protein
VWVCILQVLTAVPNMTAGCRHLDANAALLMFEAARPPAHHVLHVQPKHEPPADLQALPPQDVAARSRVLSLWWYRNKITRCRSLVRLLHQRLCCCCSQ